MHHQGYEQGSAEIDEYEKIKSTVHPYMNYYFGAVEEHTYQRGVQYNEA